MYIAKKINCYEVTKWICSHKTYIFVWSNERDFEGKIVQFVMLFNRQYIFGIVIGIDLYYLYAPEVAYNNSTKIVRMWQSTRRILNCSVMYTTKYSALYQNVYSMCGTPSGEFSSAISMVINIICVICNLWSWFTFSLHSHCFLIACEPHYREPFRCTLQTPEIDTFRYIRCWWHTYITNSSIPTARALPAQSGPPAVCRVHQLSNCALRVCSGHTQTRCHC